MFRRSFLKKSIETDKNIFRHLLVRLKVKPNQRVPELQQIRTELDTLLLNQHSDEISSITTYDHPATFVLHLSKCINNHTQLSPSLYKTLTSSKLIVSFSPALILPSENETTPVPLDIIKQSFDMMTDNVSFETAEAFALRVYPGRNSCIVPRELGTVMRDYVSARMLDRHSLHNERSYEIKEKVAGILANLQKEAEEKGLVVPRKASLECVSVLQLDIFRDAAIWSYDPVSCEGAPLSKDEARSRRVARSGALTPSERVGERVILLKIGEIFLKKGNRSKFMAQLQSNIVLKLRGKAQLERQHHFFIVSPLSQGVGPNGEFVAPKPFNDNDIKELVEIIDCIPGVENINLAYRTRPDQDSVVQTINYLIANAAASTVVPVSPNTPSQFHSIVGTDDSVKNDIYKVIFDDQEVSDKPSDSVESESDNPIRNIAEEMARIHTAGIRIEPHLHRPCSENSRSEYQKKLLTRVRHDFTLMSDRLSDKGFLDQPSDFTAPINYIYPTPPSGINIRVELTQDLAYVTYNSGPDLMEAVGGQPTGTAGETQTVICMLSGGFDSPVAAFSMMRRGMRVVLVHFQNANLADENTVKHKIVQLAERLSKFQVITHLHIVPFGAIQDAIIMEVPGPARMLVYRRFMMHTAAKISLKYAQKSQFFSEMKQGPLFVVLGDSANQVASQTAQNLYASYINAPLPILSPLIGSNKKDVISISKRIGTYDISALPYGDCCSYFLAKHPLTAIKPKLLFQYEAAVGRNVPVHKPKYSDEATSLMTTATAGADQLVKDAVHASAVFRWFKGDMEVMKELLPVKSYHNNAATELMMSCPVLPKSKRGLDAENADEENDDSEMDSINTAIDEQIDEQIEEVAVEDNFTPDELVNERLAMRTIDDTISASMDASPSRSEVPVETGQTGETKPSPVRTVSPSSVTSAYLDNAATTRMFPVAVKAMLPYLSGLNIGNTSSQHGIGLVANAAVDEARRILLGTLNASTGSTHRDDATPTTGKHVKKSKNQPLIFTSGGTESNNLALVGSMKAVVVSKISQLTSLCNSNASPSSFAKRLAGKKVQLTVRLITSATEHPSVLEPIRSMQRNPESLLSNVDSLRAYGVDVEVKVLVTELKVDHSGFVDLNQLQHALMEEEKLVDDTVRNGDSLVFPTATLVSIMHANNEVGTIQPLAKIGSMIDNHRTHLLSLSNSNNANVSIPEVVYHTDACQSYGKVHLNMTECKLDLVSINGHKLHGPKGIGALVVRPGVSLFPLVVGGGHEADLRSGTLNVPGIVGMASAAAHIYSVKTAFLTPQLAYLPVSSPLEYSVPPPTHTSVGINTASTIRSLRLQRDLENFVRTSFSKSQINGSSPSSISDEYINNYTKFPQTRLPNISSILIDRSGWMDASTIIKTLSAKNVFVSMGSACASNAEAAPSHVLVNMGVPPEQANATVRFSFSHLSTSNELDFTLNALQDLAQNMNNFKPQSR